MANPNPWQARLAKAAKQAPGDIGAFRRRTWALLCLAYDACAVEDPDERRRAMLAYVQVASVYAKLVGLAADDERPPVGDIIVIPSATGANGDHA